MNFTMRVQCRFRNAPLVSIGLVPQKAYTSVVTGAPTEAVAAGTAEGAPLFHFGTSNSLFET